MTDELEPRILETLAEEGLMPVAMLRVRLRLDKSDTPRLHRAVHRLVLGGFLIRRQYATGLPGWKVTDAARGAVEAHAAGQPWDLAILAGRAAADS